MGRGSYVNMFVSIAQAVAEKTNIKANKSEKVRMEEKITVRVSADVPQCGQGWL